MRMGCIDHRRLLWVVSIFSLWIGCGMPPPAKASTLPGIPLPPQRQKAPEISGIAAKIIADAVAMVGDRYRWGGTSPRTGFDCSGFVQYILAKAGIQVPRTADEQAGALPTARHLRPGDLLFFRSPRGPYTHVGIYIGGSLFVSAVDRRVGVQVEPLTRPFWRSTLDGVRALPAIG